MCLNESPLNCTDAAHTLEPVLVDVTDGRHRHAETGRRGAFQHHGGALLKRAVLVHEDVDGSSLELLAVKVKRGAHDEVVPAVRESRTR